MIVTSEEFLRQRSSEVELEEGEEIAEQLREELNKSEVGVGLSAPQIGLLKRVVVIKDAEGMRSFVNPEIVEKSNPFINKREGCLSFPGVWLNTIRYHNIVIEDPVHGKVKLNNFAALVAQHEVDHLDGVLFFDREVPDPYKSCFCGSEKKFKFCCYQKIR